MSGKHTEAVCRLSTATSFNLRMTEPIGRCWVLCVGWEGGCLCQFHRNCV